jgi:hypothetical protein
MTAFLKIRYKRTFPRQEETSTEVLFLTLALRTGKSRSGRQMSRVFSKSQNDSISENSENLPTSSRNE